MHQELTYIDDDWSSFTREKVTWAKWTILCLGSDMWLVEQKSIINTDTTYSLTSPRTVICNDTHRRWRRFGKHNAIKSISYSGFNICGLWQWVYSGKPEESYSGLFGGCCVLKNWMLSRVYKSICVVIKVPRSLHVQYWMHLICLELGTNSVLMTNFQ